MGVLYNENPIRQYYRFHTEKFVIVVFIAATAKNSGREGAMNLELFIPLAESIFGNWNPESFDEGLLVSAGVKSAQEDFYKY